MTMQEFEDLLYLSVTNPYRLKSEVLQLENYIFRDHERIDKNLKVMIPPQPTYDLKEVLKYYPNSSEKKPLLI